MDTRFIGENTWSEHPEYDRGFKAGQQSKQEEVNKIQVQIDELQKRIEGALYHTVNHGGYDDLTHIISILKGNKNDT